MKLKTSQILVGMTSVMLLILCSHTTASAQNSNTPVDKIQRLEIEEQKRRSYEVTKPTTLRHGLGVPRSEKELNKYQGIASKLGTTLLKLLEEFRYKTDPYPLKESVFAMTLTFKKFLQAKVIARNLEAAHPNITSDILLRGLMKRDSYAQTMRNFGLSPEEAKNVEKRAKQEIEESTR